MTSSRASLLDLGNAALIAFVVGTVGGLVPALGSIRNLVANVGRVSYGLPLLGLMFGFAVLLPLFYFALYRDNLSLKVPANLRPLALIATAALALSLLWAIPSLRTASSAVIQAPRPNYFVDLVNLSSMFAMILPPLALFLRGGQETPELQPTSGLLRWTARITLGAYGLFLAWIIVGILATPFTQMKLQEYAAQLGRTAPTVRDMLVRLLPQALQIGGLIVTPYIVTQSMTRRVRIEEEPAADETVSED